MTFKMSDIIVKQQREIAELKHAVQVQYNAAMTLDEENQLANRKITDQQRQLDDKVKLIKFTDKANGEMAQEIAELKAALLEIANLPGARMDEDTDIGDMLSKRVHQVVQNKRRPKYD